MQGIHHHGSDSINGPSVARVCPSSQDMAIEVAHQRPYSGECAALPSARRRPYRQTRQEARTARFGMAVGGGQLGSASAYQAASAEESRRGLERSGHHPAAVLGVTAARRRPRGRPALAPRIGPLRAATYRVPDRLGKS